MFSPNQNFSDIDITLKKKREKMSCMKIISLLLSNIAYIANSICIVYPFNHAN